MDTSKAIVVTGAAGFIGSYMTGYLNRLGYQNLILVDEFDDEEKELNLHGKQYAVRVERDNFLEWVSTEKPGIEWVLHLGARTDTTEFDYAIHEKLNLEYSKDIWNFCTYHTIPLIYASSAATYGAGEWGYHDDHAIVEKLQPLNPYGVSKNEFDKWALGKSGESGVGSPESPPFWAGLKFFNVYGPNEYHKGRMASVIFHAYNQIRSTGKVKLFRSHKPEFRDGEQLRDFIYVKDVARVMEWLMGQSTVDSRQSAVSSQQSAVGSRESSTVNRESSVVSDAKLTHHASRITNGLYNLGTGKARTFKDLVTAIFNSLNIPPNIEFIDTPEDIRDKYQYFTEADMSKLRNAGYAEEFASLEKGVGEYVKEFLVQGKYY